MGILVFPVRWKTRRFDHIPEIPETVRLIRALLLDAPAVLPRPPTAPPHPASPAVPPTLSCSLQILLGTLLKLTHHPELRALSRVERISVSDFLVSTYRVGQKSLS